MKFVQPPPMRSRVDERDGALLISIPRPGSPIARMVVTFYLAGLACISLPFWIIPRSSWKPAPPPAAFFFVLTAAIVLLSIVAFHLWFGREKVLIDRVAVTRWSEPLPWPLRRSRDCAHIRRLRAALVLGPLRGVQGTLAFDYGAKTVGLGASIDEAEAQMLVAIIARHFPSFGEEPRGDPRPD